MKKYLKPASKLLQRNLGIWLGRLILLPLARSLRWDFSKFPEDAMKRLVEGPPIILTFWHGEQLLMLSLYKYAIKHFGLTRRLPLFVLISAHTDGQIIAGIIRWFGLEVIMGSSTRGGKSAALALQRKLREGNHVAVTPDGPKGPAKCAKAGVVWLAGKSGVPIFPVGLEASHAFRMSSWDSMIVPKPFSRVSVVLGDPIFVPESESGVEAWRLHVQEVLNNASLEARASHA